MGWSLISGAKGSRINTWPRHSSLGGDYLGSLQIYIWLAASGLYIKGEFCYPNDSFENWAHES